MNCLHSLIRRCHTVKFIHSLFSRNEWENFLILFFFFAFRPPSIRHIFQLLFDPTNLAYLIICTYWDFEWLRWYYKSKSIKKKRRIPFKKFISYFFFRSYRFVAVGLGILQYLDIVRCTVMYSINIEFMCN